jgi:alkaline phosphatase
MKRRQFFQASSAIAVGSALLLPSQGYGSDWVINGKGKGKTAKNIIFMVSDGMSNGTLAMGDIMSQRKLGYGSHWMELYRNNRVSRALMDMASASSAITDSAAASSSWGGGVRVTNGKLNFSDSGQEHMPIWQKMKNAGKKVGCVTTVPITHATPAGFCITSKSRGEQAEIAEKYLGLRFDVMMGGGDKYFNNRKDGRNLYKEFRDAGYFVVNDATGLGMIDGSKPVLGVFANEGLPYEVDRISDVNLRTKVPSLAKMTMHAIGMMKNNKKGFCLQVEGGKVDWAAHANDSAGLIYDQLAFDEAVKTVIDFAEQDGNTLVIITSDHGNANPGLYYGDKADKNFESLFNYTHSNDWVLMGIKTTDSASMINERIKMAQGYSLNDEQMKFLLKRYSEQNAEGTYNSYKLPFKEYALYQAEHTSVVYNCMEHTADFTELAMFGPGSEKLKPFVKNTELHTFMLNAAQVENKF